MLGSRLRAELGLPLELELTLTLWFRASMRVVEDLEREEGVKTENLVMLGLAFEGVLKPLLRVRIRVGEAEMVLRGSSAAVLTRVGLSDLTGVALALFRAGVVLLLVPALDDSSGREEKGE